MDRGQLPPPVSMRSTGRPWGPIAARLGDLTLHWAVVIAALFLAFIKMAIIYQDDKIAAARRWVPVLIAIMAGACRPSLSIKALKALIDISLAQALMIGAGTAILSWAVARPVIAWQSPGPRKPEPVPAQTLGIPLICFRRRFLSFAHGANDVANAGRTLGRDLFHNRRIWRCGRPR